MLKHIFCFNIKLYLYVSIILVSCFVNKVSSNSRTSFKIMPKNYTQLFISKTNETFTKITNPNTSLLSQEEIGYLNSNYIYNIYSNETYSTLFKYSSRTFNELTTFSSCLKYRTSNNTYYTYITVQLIATNSHKSNFDNLNKVSTFGVCIVKNGIYNNTTAIGNILNAVNNATDNFFNLNHKTIKIFEMTQQTKIKDSFIIIFLALIPLYTLLLFSGFSLFDSIPKFLFAKCFKRTYKVNNQSSSSQLLSISNSGNINTDLDSKYSSNRDIETNKKNLFLFLACFNCTENIEEVFSTELVTKLNNENGLSYAKGLRGVGMILMVFGMCYIQLTQVPTKIYEQHKFNEELRNALFAIFAFSARVSPRLLFSVSGFICIFKYLSYLDEEVEKREEEEEEEERLEDDDDFLDKDAQKQPNITLNDEGIASSGGSQNLDMKNDNIKLDQVFKEGLLLRKNENNQKKITFFSVIKFYSYQLHKMIILLQAIMMFKYSIQRLSILGGLINPAYILFFVKYSLSVSIFDILEHFLVFGNFNLTQIKRSDTKSNTCILPMFWMVINEIFFFVFTLPIIFISYKKLWNLPLMLLLLYFILTSLRILIYYWLIDTKENVLKNYYDLTTPFGMYSIQPLINWSYYVLGMFFGTLNYALQKGYSEYYNGYLSCSLSIVYFLKSQSKFIIGFFATLEIVFVILLSLMTQISYFVYKGNYDYKNDKMLIPNIIHLVDIDIIIILIHLMLISFYVKGGNYLTQKLSSNIWNFSNKLYFIFCLFLNFCVTWAYYQSETRICLGMFSYFYYGLINLVMIFIIMFCNCSFIEFPLKRIIQFLKEHNKTKSVENKT